MNRVKEKLVPILAGPTGVGKTELSIILANQLNSEIVSADSRQIYKYMNIGTAKPPRPILEKTQHHFIDMLEPDKRYSAGQYGLDARNVIRDIFKKSRTPLVVGGSGLYIKALTEGFFRGDVHDSPIRRKLMNKLQKEGTGALFNDLMKIDPDSAVDIHPNNGKRIIRALEVYLASGEKLSELQRRKVPQPDFRFIKFGLTMDRNKLYERINLRVDKMFELGLIEEVKAILEKGYPENLNSLNSVGYKEVIQYLNGESDLETCVSEVKKNSRRYAKRQLTWFRADADIQWYTVDPEHPISEIASKIHGKYREASMQNVY